jgi:sulfur carrier protein
MEIFVNNQPIQTEEHTSLFSLVFSQVGENSKGLAVAINEEVIPKNEWEKTILNQNDQVLIIKATQGG